jgi:nicotinate-nucleotide adenylyltransferase
MRVAILGGSFNPPHMGHLLAAHYVWATEEVDEVWLMPSFQHPFRKALAPFEDRLAMCELLCRDTSGWMKTSRVEQELGGEGRTIDTVLCLKERYPQATFAWIVGSDLLGDLPKWKRSEELQQLIRFIVVHRAGFPSGAQGPALVEVSSTDVRRRIGAGEAVGGLVPRSVLAYLHQRRLY